MEKQAENNSFNYNSDASEQPSQPEPTQAGIKWQASEFIDHQKTSGWFIILILVALTLSTTLYLITQDVLSSLVILVAAVAFGVFASKKPRTLTYSLSTSSLTIDGKKYQYEDFRSFSLIQEGALYGIMLEPTKRFLPPLTIYFDPSDGETIFDTLAQHLPHEEKAPDFVERFMRKIRF
jgi:hypothetical protein